MPATTTTQSVDRRPEIAQTDAQRAAEGDRIVQAQRAFRALVDSRRIDEVRPAPPTGPPPNSTAQPAPNAPQPALTAEVAFQEGKKHLRANHLAPARAALRRAAALRPDATEYALYADWAAFLLIEDDATRQRALPALSQRVSKALAQDRELAFGYYVRARILLIRGDEAKAEKAFRVAARLDPSDVDTTRHLRVLERRSKPGA